MTSRTFQLSLIIVASFLLIFSCSKDDNKPTEPKDNTPIEYSISSNEVTNIEFNEEFHIEIPSNTLDSNVVITISELTSLGLNNFEGMEQVGKIYEIQHDQISFNNSVLLYFDIPDGYNGKDLFIGRYDGVDWQVLATYYDEQMNRLVAETSGFSIFSIFSGNKVEISKPRVDPTAYTGIAASNPFFEKDLRVQVTLKDPEDEIAKIACKISFPTLVSAETSTLSQFGNLMIAATTGYNAILVLFSEQDGNEPSGIFEMNPIDANTYEFVLGYEFLDELYKYGGTFDKIIIEVYGIKKSNSTVKAGEVIVPVTVDLIPGVKLISPIGIGNSKPIMRWEWMDLATSDLGTKYWGEGKFKIYISESTDPFNFWTAKTWTYVNKIFNYDNSSNPTSASCDKLLNEGDKYYWGIILSLDNIWGNNDDIKSTIESFLVMTDLPAKMQITTPSNTQSGNIEINYTLTDTDGGKNNLLFSHEWQGIEKGSITISNSSAGSLAGKNLIENVSSGQHSFTWNSSADYPNNRSNYVKIIGKIKQTDGSFLRVAESNYFTVDNTVQTSNIIVTNPNSSTVWTQGQQNVPIEWNTGDLGGNVKISIFRPYPNTFEEIITTSTNNNGNFSEWDVPLNFTPASDYRIIVRSLTDNSKYDDSEPFEIKGSGDIIVKNPNSSTVWTQGQQNVPIEWETGDLGGSVKINLFKGTSSSIITTIVNSTNNDGSYSTWDVPSNIEPANDYYISIGLLTDTDKGDYSEQFEIKATGNIKVTNPNSATVWTQGQQNVPIEWNTGDLGGNVQIFIWRNNPSDKIEIASSTSNDGSYEFWDIPDDIQPNTDYKVRVLSESNPLKYDDSDFFEIKSTTSSISIIQPNSSTIWTLGEQNVSIEWDTGNLEGNVEIFMWRNNLSNRLTIAESTINDGSTTWNVPDVTSTETDNRIRIVWLNDPNIYVDSEPFEIRQGSDEMGIPCPDMPKVYYEGGPNNDSGGDYYNTVQIGDQCWLKENLNIGIKINSNSSSDNQTNNEIIEKYCYKNDELNCNKYGGLYQWGEAVQYIISEGPYDQNEGTQGICPSGWHIPTTDELHILIDLVNNNSNALKNIGEGVGNGIGTNTSGFSGLLAGFRYNSVFINGGFNYLGVSAYFWSSRVYDYNKSYYFHFWDAENGYVFNFEDPSFGISVRCLRD